MNTKTKKIIAREILLLFVAVGLTLLAALVVWIYFLVINKKIENKENSINKYQNELSNNFKNYNEKVSRIKAFIGKLKIKEDENSGSAFSLYLLSKEMKVNDAVKKYDTEQPINGQLPNVNDTLTYYSCLRTFQKIKLPKGFVLDFNDKDALSVWNCLLANKEYLFYFLPLSFLEEYNIKTRPELHRLIENYSLSSDEIKNARKIETINNQIIRLQNEKTALSKKEISNQALIRITMMIFVVIVVIVYPIRFLVIAFQWALKTYRQSH